MISQWAPVHDGKQLLTVLTELQVVAGAGEDALHQLWCPGADAGPGEESAVCCSASSDWLLAVV